MRPRSRWCYTGAARPTSPRPSAVTRVTAQRASASLLTSTTGCDATPSKATVWAANAPGHPRAFVGLPSKGGRPRLPFLSAAAALIRLAAARGPPRRSGATFTGHASVALRLFQGSARAPARVRWRLRCGFSLSGSVVTPPVDTSTPATLTPAGAIPCSSPLRAAGTVDVLSISLNGQDFDGAASAATTRWRRSSPTHLAAGRPYCGRLRGARLRVAPQRERAPVASARMMCRPRWCLLPERAGGRHRPGHCCRSLGGRPFVCDRLHRADGAPGGRDEAGPRDFDGPTAPINYGDELRGDASLDGRVLLLAAECATSRRFAAGDQQDDRSRTSSNHWRRRP